MSSMQAAGAAVTLPGEPFPLGAAPGELLGVAEVREDERKPGDTVTAGPRSVVVLRSGHPG